MSGAVTAVATRAARRWNWPLLVLLAGAAVLFLAGLGQSTLWDQDEAKYTQVAREILQTGDPITLHVNGTPWFVHPPLFMWLQAATAAIFGFTEFTARIWSAIFGVVGIYATVLLGTLLFGRRTALMGAVILATTFQYFAQSRLAVFDGVLAAFMLLAFYAFLRWLRGHGAGFAYWTAVWAGLGTLTKGPIALLLPGLVAFGYLLVRRPGVMRWRFWVGPALVYGAIAAPWYLIEWIRHGWPFVRTVIGYYTVNRFVGVVEGQSGPWWYYAPVFGLGAFPWTAFLVAMIPYHVARLRNDGSLMVLLWCGVTVIFYSIAGTKLPNYILPVYPFVALGIAGVWDSALAGQPMARRTLAVAFAFTLAGLAVFAGEITAFARIKYAADLAAIQRHLVAVAIVLGMWLVLAAALYAMRLRTASFAAVALTTVLLAGALVARTLPLVEERRPNKAIAAAVLDALGGDNAPLVGYRFSDHQTLLYYTNHPVLWIDSLSQMINLACYQPKLILVTTVDQWRWWKTVASVYVSPATTVVMERYDQIVVEMRRSGSCRVPAIGR